MIGIIGIKGRLTALFSCVALAGAGAAVVVSCGAAGGQKWHEDALVIGYWPNIDAALALNAPVRGSSKQNGAFPAWLNGTKWSTLLPVIEETKPLWDQDQMDEEYWRGINGNGRYVLSYERWIKPPQKQFITNDNRIRGAEFDYNEGYANEKYVWKAEGTNALTIENKGAQNYLVSNDLWQIRDMSAILNKAASSLDTVYSTDLYSKQAKRVIKQTNDHWSKLAALQKAKKASLLDIDPTKTSWASDDDPNRERLLVISIEQKQTASVEAATQTAILATPSMHKELYTKAHFTMPPLTNAQLAALNVQDKQNKFVKDNKGLVSSPSENGVYFPEGLTETFWSAWAGKVDKIIFGVPTASMDITAAKISQLYPSLANLITGGLKDENIMVTNFYLAGGNSYGFRMPIGQNTVIDQIARKWYGATDNSAVFDWNF